MSLIISARVLAASNLHPEDEPGFFAGVIFRPPYALPRSQGFCIDRFTCPDHGSNIMLNMSNNPILDTIGYVVVFSSFEEITNDPNSSLEDPSECKSVAFNYGWGIEGLGKDTRLLHSLEILSLMQSISLYMITIQREGALTHS